MALPGGSTGADAQTFAILSLYFVAAFGGLRLYQWRKGGLDPDEWAESYIDWAGGAVIWGLLFASLTIGLAVVTNLPLTAIGVGGWTVTDLRVGLGLGLALLGVSLLLQVALALVGLPESETWLALQDLSTPSRRPEWALHTIGVKPVNVVGFELLFRGGLVGGPAAAWGLGAPVLVALSAGAEGLYSWWVGPRATAVSLAVGAGLGVGFVATGSLLVPIVAHLVMDFAESVRRLVTAGPRRGSAAL